jgi:CHAT domain-containing protein
VSEARTWAFVIGRDPASGTAALQQVATIEITAADLLKTVDSFVRAIASKEDTVAEASRALGKLLIDPVQERLAGKTRLVVIPDAFLWTLPFEALQTASGRYLIEDASISYGLSLTALETMTTSVRPHPARASVVALANPVLGTPAEERIALMRPAASVKPSASAEREARNVAALFGPASSRVLLGAQAGAGRILQAASAGSILHLAVPVFVSNASPLYSLVALTPADTTDADAGLVEVADVMGWELPADAVVFSRVDASGGAASGNGLAGLSWCLFAAGVPTVVANRWALGEPGAGALITGMYRARVTPLAGRPAGRTMAESVQRAAKRQLAQPATRHPYYWAGLMVIGR